MEDFILQLNYFLTQYLKIQIMEKNVNQEYILSQKEHDTRLIVRNNHTKQITFEKVQPSFKTYAIKSYDIDIQFGKYVINNPEVWALFIELQEYVRCILKY